MLELGFTHCQTEHAVFYCYKDEDVLIMSVDVDDLTMAGNMHQAISMFKVQLSCKFKIKDLGELCWLLGIEVKLNHNAHTPTRYWRNLAYTKQIPC